MGPPYLGNVNCFPYKKAHFSTLPLLLTISLRKSWVPQYTRGEKKQVNPIYKRLMSKAENRFKRGLTMQAQQFRKAAQQLPSKDPQDSNYRRLRYCRYADDFALGFIGPKEEAEAIKQQLATFLREELKLSLSGEKTLITHARSSAAKFLGYEVTILQNDAK